MADETTTEVKSAIEAPASQALSKSVMRQVTETNRTETNVAR